MYLSPDRSGPLAQGFTLADQQASGNPRVARTRGKCFNAGSIAHNAGISEPTLSGAPHRLNGFLRPWSFLPRGPFLGPVVYLLVNNSMILNREYFQSPVFPSAPQRLSLEPLPLASSPAADFGEFRVHDFERDEGPEISWSWLCVERLCPYPWREPSGSKLTSKSPSGQLPWRRSSKLLGRIEIFSPAKNQVRSLLRLPSPCRRDTFYQGLAYFASEKIRFFVELGYSPFTRFGSPSLGKPLVFIPETPNIDFQRPTEVRHVVMCFLPKRPYIQSHFADTRGSSMTLSCYPRLKLDAFNNVQRGA